MILLIIRLLLAVALAFTAGKLVARCKLPAILGWLISGMLLGPHALALVSNELLTANWYQSGIHVLECVVGLMIGTELVWSKIKKSGKSIFITTLTQSLGTFFLVSLVFSVLFYFTKTPLYLAFVFGGIALATAPAPALSIVREFKTDGPVTRTLIPMAALDDVVGVVVFFTTISIIAGKLSGESFSFSMVAMMILLPLMIGAAMGVPAGFLLKRKWNRRVTLVLLLFTTVATAGVGFLFNQFLLPKPVLNFMLIGMAFSASFANLVPEERLIEIMRDFNPFLGASLLVVILNLGAPLDYHLMLSAGIFTLIYILARALGKYSGAYFGASITNAPSTVKKYLGLTLLPHSGVSLVFTGIAVSVLSGPAPACATIVQGTIAAAAVLNEIIAVIMAKKGFELAGEIPDSPKETTHVLAFNHE